MEDFALKILSAKVTNFASYKELDFDFTSKGLTLVSGPTGAGKSTLCDIVPWILFGRTAKNGSVDEVRSWTATEPTEGTITCEINGKLLQVGRARGGAKGNDLIIWQDSGVYRGKDLNDTQKQINQLLNCDADLYLSGAYFHEFSQTAAFFTLTAKQRRQITEQIVDLSMAINLNDSLTEYRKGMKVDKETNVQTMIAFQAKIELAKDNITLLYKRALAWNIDKTSKIASLKNQVANFDARIQSEANAYQQEHIKKRVELEYEVAEYENALIPKSLFIQQRHNQNEALASLGDTKCTECGAPTKVEQRMLLTKNLHRIDQAEAQNETAGINLTKAQERLIKHNELLKPKLKQLLSAQNTYQDQLDEAESAQNPYAQQVQEQEKALADYSSKAKDVQTAIDALSQELGDIDLLLETINTFRASLIQGAVSQLQDNTNQLLTDYFDAEIRVEFSATNADKLDVTIYKDGNICSYTQLSKGQRGLLKLCFGVSAMQIVANHHGLDFSTLFFDEALDGLDETLKIKAYRLLEHLSTKYDSIYCVEHNEAFKTMFTRRLDVELVDGKSQIEEN